MNPVQCLILISAAVAVTGANRLAVADPSPAGAPREEERVKQLDHPRAQLPGVPPVRLTRAFTLQNREPRTLGSLVAFSSDGKLLAAARTIGRERRDVAVWDIEKRKLLHVLTQGGEGDYTYSAIAFLPPGDRLVTACVNLNSRAPCPWCRKVCLWDARSGKLLDAVEPGLGPRDDITGLAAVGDGSRVICCGRQGLFEWDVKGKTHRALPLEEHVPLTERGKTLGSPPRCRKAAATSDGSRFATTVFEGVRFEPRILVWDAAALRVTRAIPVPRVTQEFAYAPNGSSVAISYYDSHIGKAGDVVYLWDAVSGRKLAATGGVWDYEWHVYRLAFTPDGRNLIAVCQLDGPGGKFYAVVWDVASGKLANRIEGIHAADISPDGKYLAVSGRDIEFYRIEYADRSKDAQVE